MIRAPPTEGTTMRGHTAGATAVRRILRAHAVSEATGIGVDEVLEGACDGTPRGRRVTRRQLLGGAAAAGAGAVVPGLGAAPVAAAPGGKSAPSVAVVGAGLAGLRAAHWLWRVKGIRSTVYEADDSRLGGRCWTLRGYFDHGHTVEHGGAFINTDHNSIRNLVNSLGLGLHEVGGGNQPPYGDVYWVDGAPYTYDEANEDWGEVWRVFKDALAAAPYPQTAFSRTDAGLALDAMTVDEWIAANIPGGLSGRFGRIMRSNAIAEYGLDPDEQSALNLVYLLGLERAELPGPDQRGRRALRRRRRQRPDRQPDGRRATAGAPWRPGTRSWPRPGPATAAPG